MIENQLQGIVDALNRLAVAYESMAEGKSPQGDTEPVVEVIQEIKPEPVAHPTAETVDLSTAPVAPPQPGVNGAEVVAPVAQPPIGVTKAALWDELQATYSALMTVKRGQEIGALLGEYNAMHLDQLAPEHYVVVYQKLLDLKAEVTNG